MSNFACEKCGTLILEDANGSYYTECEHWPLETFEENKILRKIMEELAEIIIRTIKKKRRK